MKKIYSFVLIAAFALTACQKGGPAEKVNPDVMTFNVMAPGAQTKVSNDAFESDDVIGVYVTDYVDDVTPMPLQNSGNRANNVAVTYDGAQWTPQRTICWGEGKSDVYAYYPYIGEMEDVEYHYFSIATDQTTKGDENGLGGYEASDFLWGKAEGLTREDGTVNIAMKHLMSKLTVKIVAGEDYVGSLPEDARVELHSTVTGVRIDLTQGSLSKDPYSSAHSIKMKKLGVRSYEGVEAVVYEAIVVPQMIEGSVPLLEINSKSVSYLLEDSFNFRPGTAYTYTATLNTSTTAIKVDIGCELEDWNSTGGDNSGDSGDNSGDGSQEDEILENYTNLSENGSANCYIVSQAGDYRLASLLGNTDATVGNVKSVEVLWESFGTDQMPNVGDLIDTAFYSNGYICFSTPETFREGNAVIAAKNSSGVILWSWHIWLTDLPAEQIYYNNAGVVMDRNLGATSATPGDVGALGLLYQWGRKDPFLGSSSISSIQEALSTGKWYTASGGNQSKCEENPTTFYTNMYLPDGSWSIEKSPYDPCPAGWRVPDGGKTGLWATASGMAESHTREYDSKNQGINFSGGFGEDQMIWYSESGYRFYGSGELNYVGYYGLFWSCSPSESYAYAYSLYISYGNVNPSGNIDRAYGYSVRCVRE